ncbi:MAG: hypothetical protein Ct9H90mP18_02680 [Gammaproteobacteria bacterium]|nr:MAG: hypothetical protein Ct9H90mP18_02680 [Gammaproteobacteria bacterium]
MNRLSTKKIDNLKPRNIAYRVNDGMVYISILVLVELSHGYSDISHISKVKER